MSVSVATVIVAGLTGAGKSSALQQLERLGFTTLESLPPHLIAPTLEQVGPQYPRLAIGLDLRRLAWLDYLDSFWAYLDKHQPTLVFLDARDDRIVQRLTALRRTHPFVTQSASVGILEAIQTEREWLDRIRQRSTHIMDTSDLSLADLRERLDDITQARPQILSLTLLSFGFKFGVPVDANLMFDVRFLVNPYYDPDLRILTGQDPALQAFLFADPLTQTTYQTITDLLNQWLPAYSRERRSQVTLAIGCTGGQHRSVALIERLAQDLKTQWAQDPDPAVIYQLSVIHRHVKQSQAELAQVLHGSVTGRV